MMVNQCLGCDNELPEGDMLCTYCKESTLTDEALLEKRLGEPKMQLRPKPDLLDRIMAWLINLRFRRMLKRSAERQMREIEKEKRGSENRLEDYK